MITTSVTICCLSKIILVHIGIHSEDINPKTFASQRQEAGDFWHCKNVKEPTTQTPSRDNSCDQSSLAVTSGKFKETPNHANAQHSEMDYHRGAANEPSKTETQRTSVKEEVEYEISKGHRCKFSTAL